MTTKTRLAPYSNPDHTYTLPEAYAEALEACAEALHNLRRWQAAEQYAKTYSTQEMADMFFPDGVCVLDVLAPSHFVDYEANADAALAALQEARGE